MSTVVSVTSQADKEAVVCEFYHGLLGVDLVQDFFFRKIFLLKNNMLVQFVCGRLQALTRPQGTFGC